MAELPDPSMAAMQPLALRPKAAAEALGIGQRLLWQLTAPRGPIRCVRAGTAVLYPIAELQRYLAEQMEGGRHE